MMKLETSGESEIGNTKQSRVNQLMKWCFTFNNYTKGDIERLEIKFKEICKKYVFQEEKGKCGTIHLQGAIWLKVKMRYTEFDLNKKIHWEPMRNEKASAEYCQKSDTNNGDIFIFGFPKPLKLIDENKLYPWQEEIKKLVLETEPDDRTIHLFYEETGNIGKSQFIRMMLAKYGGIYCCGGEYKDIMNIIFNNDMDANNVVYFNIVRAGGGNISYKSLESIKDGMVCNTKFETGFKIFNPPHVIVMANFPPENVEKLSADRWKIKEILPQSSKHA